MKTFRFKRIEYVQVKAPVPEMCCGCHWEKTPCLSVRKRHACHREGTELKPHGLDTIFIENTPEKIAAYLVWRANGYPVDDDA